jgi:hypothetical protein
MPEAEEHVVDADDARIRILVCYDCDSIDPLPVFNGPPEYDEFLTARIEGHKTAGGTPHRGRVFTVSEKSWDNPEYRAEILRELDKARNGGETGLGARFYDVRSTFQEDAMNCWRHKHNRTENCEDYKSDKMRLVPDTKEERKDLGLETRARYLPGGTYLCMFCPYASIVMQRQRKAQGYY